MTSLVFSKNRDDHVTHLRNIFDRCRSLGISLNPKKSIMGVFEGKLLGHIVSQDGVQVDPDRVKGYKKFHSPRTKKQFNLSLAGSTS
jgi:hypothetical protein